MIITQLYLIVICFALLNCATMGHGMNKPRSNARTISRRIQVNAIQKARKQSQVSGVAITRQVRQEDKREVSHLNNRDDLATMMKKQERNRKRKANQRARDKEAKQSRIEAVTAEQQQYQSWRAKSRDRYVQLHWH